MFMRLKICITSIPLLFTLLCPAGWCLNAARQYWVGFISTVGSFPAVILMKIDSSGEIIQSPRIAFVRTHQLTSLALANAEGLTDLNVYFMDGHFNREKRTERLFVAKVPKATGKAISFRATNIHVTNYLHLQVTQKRTDNFIALSNFNFAMMQGRLYAYGTKSDGLPDNSSWLLTEHSLGSGLGGESCLNCAGSVSSDGRYAVFVDLEPGSGSLIYSQKLGVKGMPLGPANFIDNTHGRGGATNYEDVSGILHGEKRMIVYDSFPGGPGGSGPARIFLQAIDSATGEKMGHKIVLQTDVQEAEIEGLAIDPFGQFLIYAQNSGSCGLCFQPLDQRGNALGRPRALSLLQAIRPDILLDLN
ncbi:MAG: hypothetical protein C5B54_12155 [Acidobacteria bacterium]|nr:MAG: hypothetical protein C5B54_12155 [Acidobacteriota bacterium]